MSDACRAVKAAKAKYRRTGKAQQVRFRSRKDPDQCFGFDAVSLKSTNVFSREHILMFLASENVPTPDAEGTRIVYQSGRWFVVVPVLKPVRRQRDPSLPTAAIDPGVRCFVTFYSERGVGQIGKQDFGRIQRLCSHYDELQSRMSQAKSRQKQRMLKAMRRMRWRIRDLIRDLHAKTAKFFAETFSRVFIPAFETQQMVSRLRSKTARAMLTFSHFAFRQALQHACKLTGCVVEVVSEAYTSRTCSYCGTVHPKNSRPTLRCCNTTLDRDLNGARGIYLRALRASSCGTSVPLHCIGNNL